MKPANTFRPRREDWFEDTECSTAAPSATVSSLWEMSAQRAAADAAFYARDSMVQLRAMSQASILFGQLERLRGRRVLLATHAQLPSAIALLELDGVARRLVLCTPDLTPEQMSAVAATAEADAILVDEGSASSALPVETFFAGATPAAETLQRRRTHATEWILLTSGTTGQPKLVVHDVGSLAGALPRQTSGDGPMVWSTFYDIRRYGGLQIYLRAVLSGSGLVLSSAGETVREFLTRAAAAGVTHISGTPSHWRRALMSGDTGLIEPGYVRLSGEVADQTVLDSLKAAYPNARVAHAFASTEAGVAFDVNDGLAGFPAQLVDKPGSIELKVQEGTLWIRSGRTAMHYLGNAAPLASEDRFVDTGDIVALENGRYHFRGRKGGVINVGGLKVYPEEVESVLNADPRVQMSRVLGRRNPITGAVVIAEVVLNQLNDSQSDLSPEILKDELLQACRRTLAAHKVPAMLRFVPSLELTAAGKLVRPGA